MASELAARRLRKEYLSLKKSPVENIVACPLDSNILNWHYCIKGTPGTPYEGGYYHGMLKFPSEYPMKPPSVLMITKNGRFEINRRLCLSMSDFHPETWNPMWSVSSILTGLYSFMIGKSTTLGSITTSSAEKRKLAKLSLGQNCLNRHFRECFPQLVELHQEQQQQVEERESSSTDTLNTTPTDENMGHNAEELMEWAQENAFDISAAIIALFSFLLFVYKILF